jgi:hypothetical protein
LNDLRSDAILIRKIKRMQQAEAAEAEESSDDEAETKHFAGSNGAPRSSAMLRDSNTQQPPQASIVEDLGDPSDAESASQQPPMGSMVEDLGDPSESEEEL